MTSLYAICKFSDEGDQIAGVPLSWVTVNDKDEEKSMCKWPGTNDMRVVKTLIDDHTRPANDWPTFRCRVLTYSTKNDLEKKMRRAEVSDFEAPSEDNMPTIEKKTSDSKQKKNTFANQKNAQRVAGGLCVIFSIIFASPVLM